MIILLVDTYSPLYRYKYLNTYIIPAPNALCFIEEKGY